MENNKEWKEISLELRKLRNANPSEFWKILSENAICLWHDFFEKEEDFIVESNNDLLKKQLVSGNDEPFHKQIIYWHDGLFPIILDIMCQGDKITSKNICTNVLIPIYGERYYAFHLAEGENDKYEIDVFTPHMLDRYANRTPKILDEPNNISGWKHYELFHESKKPKMAIISNAKIIGKFFGRNKMSEIYPAKEIPNASSLNEEIEENDQICVWPEGMTTCVEFSIEHPLINKIQVHKTFISYEQLKKEQIKSIMPLVFDLLSQCRKQFPKQYL